jgi:hypothetical protein
MKKILVAGNTDPSIVEFLDAQMPRTHQSGWRNRLVPIWCQILFVFFHNPSRSSLSEFIQKIFLLAAGDDDKARGLAETFIKEL